ncbi:DUF998 domain-containing protein [Aggregatimonas sangjinii]|uniref:DUF998 domain-containing protein n=1 Tax=Aggregatimonas sangjinii TaxID=2583587 RepID=A0A5B7SX36_9FLAO|nr:DUF998 domain-containing protein [Aggregatimonas sangjinii]QCX01294.1 DUF998 domain-containing protein [Aggregatimonas sangjinii]
MKKMIVSSLGILGALLFIVSSILGGLWIEGYSFVHQYISESFATGVPDAEYLRYLYMASGASLLLFGCTAPSYFPKSKGIVVGFFTFALLYGFGNIVVALFPCDFGCPTDIETASLAQFVHNTSALLTYSLVPFCLLGIGFSAKKGNVRPGFVKMATGCGILALIFVVVLFGNPQGRFVGLFQRVIEGSILFWVIYTSLYISKTTTANN